MPDESKILPVLLAGGGGTRLWPVSSDQTPKQFQRLVGPLSTYQLTLQRVADPGLFMEPVVVTAAAYAGMARDAAACVGSVPAIVAEPARRDSAAAIAVAAILAERRGPGTLVLALAADHLIDDAARFLDAVRLGRQAAAEDRIVVFGIKPSEPVTSYGYIRPGQPLHGHVDLLNVEAFVEKPDRERAIAYVAAGYLWNSGNFLFRSDVMIRAFKTHAPDILEAVQEAIERATSHDGVLRLDAASFAQARKTSVDHAIIEKTDHIAVVVGHFPWSDIGSWAALADVIPHDANGNGVQGLVHLVDSRNCLVHSEGLLTAAVGLTDMVIVATREAVLVIPKSRSQEVKQIAEAVQNQMAVAPSGSPGVPQPWGTLRQIGAQSQFTLQQLTIEPGKSCRLMVREGMSWAVAAGTARVEINGRISRVPAGTPLAAMAGDCVDISNEAATPLELIELCCRAS